MKNKPLRHKESNTFKFIPFSERISNVKIDVVHKVKHKYELDTEDTTYFHQAYEKWFLLNGSNCFDELKQDIHRDVQTLPQVLARKEELINALKKHLTLKNNFTLEAVLELIVALAKDLRQEFFPYFPSVYPLIISLLDIKDAAVLEWTFQCLAYLFKYLWRCLLNNFSSVFESIVPLLGKNKPSYINAFAAQSFAYVARKVKDESKLVKLVLRPLQENPQAVVGFGRLIFEIIKGVSGQFHSCGEKTLSAFILVLQDPAYPHTLVCELLYTILSHLLPFLNTEGANSLLKILEKCLRHYCSIYKNENKLRNIANIEQVICMIQESIEYKSCFLLVEPDRLGSALLELLEPENIINEAVSDRISQTLSYILVNFKTFDQELSSRIVITAMMYLNEKELLTFVWRIKEYTAFDGLVLPKLLTFCLEKSSPDKLLPCLAKFVLYRAPPATDITKLMVWTPYTLNFTSHKDSSLYYKTYIQTLSNRSIHEHLECLDDCIRILLVLPHILPVLKEEAISNIKSLIETVCDTIAEIKEERILRKSLFILSTALETLIHLKPNECITKLLPPQKIVPILLKYSSHQFIFVLRALDFYVSLDELNEIIPYAKNIQDHLYSLLISPYQKVRLHVTHILYEVEKSVGTNEMMSSILKTCWDSECVSLTITDYREKLRILQNLDCSNENYKLAIAQNKVDGKIPLRYLLGTLFLNFKLLLEPVSKIIMSYGSSLTPIKFWDIFGNQLKDIAETIKNCNNNPTLEFDFTSTELNNEFSKLNDLAEKPDYIHYRIMLWNILKDLPDIYEYQSKNIVILFLCFMEEEYNKRYHEFASSCDLRKSILKSNALESSLNSSQMLVDSNSAEDENIEMDLKDTSLNDKDEQEVVDQTVDEEEEDLDVSTKEESSITSVGKWVTKTLLSHMAVFGKFRSPKSLYREPELNSIFLGFLSSRIMDIQKSALDFICCYKEKNISPYKEHLYGLIDDTTFKNELALFSIDKQSDQIKSEHRPHLMPLVIRIVHSKMNSSIKSSSRETRQARRAAILRFISGCSNEELLNFFHMAFAGFIEQVKGDSCETIIAEIMDSFNIQECIPLRRLLITSDLLNTVITYCGGVLESEQMSLLLRLILLVACHASCIYARRTEIEAHYVKTLKLLRAKCFQLVSLFFETFENYEWTENEIETLFKVIVWPYLEAMQSQGVNGPTAQMKLFIIWSKDKSFLHMLTRKDSKEHSPLSAMINLWKTPKIHPSVHNVLIEFICNILDLYDAEEVSSGFDILKNYVPEILSVLQTRLNSKKSLSNKELSILSIITSNADDSIPSDSIVSLLLPSLLKSSKRDDSEVTDLINTMGNLVKKTENSSSYLKQLLALFSSLQSAGHRKQLLYIVIDISKISGNVLDEELLHDLNAFDPKWVEQPDFDRRCKAFIAIDALDVCDPIMASIILRTAYYYLRSEASLKESAWHCLKTLPSKVSLAYAEDKEVLKFLLDQTLLPLIKSGLSDESETFRQECISVLGFLVRDCSTLHDVLRDLFPFSNKRDLEVDFFENIIHLQLHRRVRAMLRFAEILEGPECKVHSKTLIMFVLPMINQFLLSRNYASKNTIVDSAIKALGSICQSLTWKYYYTILKYYLEKLKSGTEFQKQVIRIISEVLNSFHFDLSLADDFKYSNKKNVAPGETETVKEVSGEGPLEESLLLDGETDNDKTILTDNMEVESSKDIILDKSSANRVIYELVVVVLPSLQKILGEKSNADSFHKVNKKMSNNDRDDDDILRIPLAIVIVKLLQKLPSVNLLERNISGIFLKLANFLKTKSEQVRRTTRSTLEAIMISLGPRYLPRIISELCSILTKGFHIHVLTYTVHAILNKLRDLYAKTDIDSCIHEVISVCTTDLFGTVSEEKEVNQISSKTFEAKANRSYDIFYILAAYCSENYLLDLILPLKEELGTTVSHKTINKCTTCLEKIALGLTENEFISPQSLLEFAYGVSSESIPALSAKEKDKINAKQLEYESRKDPDAFIIPQEPKQKKALMNIECVKTNAHIFVEFGLKLLYFILKREKLNKLEFKPVLNPLVKILLDCLKSKHVKVSTIALKCYSWILQYDLPSVNSLSNIKEISTMFFDILHKYAVAGLSKGDNYDLVMAAFKAMNILVRYSKIWKPSDEERRMLILYCEQDIEDRERQATAFTLLKTLIQQHANSEELSSVMKKVATISITSLIDSVREQARQVTLTYLMEYKLGKQVLTFLSFYLSQLNYETKIGRESALKMVRMFVEATSKIPQRILNDESGVIYVNVSTRLINEEETDCKQNVAALIDLLIRQLDQNARDKLFDVTTTWMTGKKVLHKRLGMQLAGIFANAEKNDFVKRLPSFLPLMVNEFCLGFNQPGRFVLKKIETSDEPSKTAKDQLTFHSINCFIKLFTLFPDVLKDNQYNDSIIAIENECQALLSHEHSWVRTLAIQLLGLILTSRRSSGTKSLALDLLSQLTSSAEEALLMQSMKLLVHIAEMIAPETENEITLPWLIRKVRHAVNKEIIYFPTCNQIRKMACRWGAALSLKLNRTHLQSIAFDLLTPIIKEMSSEDGELAKAAKESAGYIKGKLGQDIYDTLVAKISQNIDAKKALRRKERNQLAVTDPERAAKRKINKQLKKKVLKKRKVELMKTHRYKRKRKASEVVIDDA